MYVPKKAARHRGRRPKRGLFLHYVFMTEILYFQKDIVNGSEHNETETIK